MGCRSGCFRLIGVAAAVVLIAAAISLIAAFIVVRSIKPRLVEYVTAPVIGQTLDFWDDPLDECRGVDIAIRSVTDARRAGRTPNLSIVDRLPGHHAILRGIRVQRINVRTILCEGITERFAHVRVVDERSPLFLREGYVTDDRIIPAGPQTAR
jgi:hypothetical protein